MTVALEAADADALAYVEALLDRVDLPTADVRDQEAEFYVAAVDDDRVGVGGLEVHDDHGLLRSVAVAPDQRGNGYGTAICDALEARARDAGVDTLYLLTTTANEFFADRGYVEVGREDAPAPIRNTTEFSELCPSSAVCMQQPL